MSSINNNNPTQPRLPLESSNARPSNRAKVQPKKTASKLPKVSLNANEASDSLSIKKKKAKQISETSSRLSSRTSKVASLSGVQSQSSQQNKISLIESALGLSWLPLDVSEEGSLKLFNMHQKLAEIEEKIEKNKQEILALREQHYQSTDSTKEDKETNFKIRENINFKELQGQQDLYQMLILKRNIIKAERKIALKEEELYKAKKEFMTRCLGPGAQSALFFTEYRSVPIASMAISSLAKSYSKWDHTPPELLSELKNKIAIQHKNIDVLCKELQSFQDKRELLLQIAPKKEFRAWIEQALSGAGELTADQMEEFRRLISNAIEKLECVDKPKTREPIDQAEIHMQAELYKVSRSSLAWAFEQNKLIKLKGANDNDVYPLHGLEIVRKRRPLPNEPTAEYLENVKYIKRVSERPIAYYKEGQGGDPAHGIMETIVWKIAAFFDDKEKFTPTKMAAVVTKSNKKGDDSINVINVQGELVSIKNIEKKAKGGLQIARKGILLDRYLDNGESNHKITFTQSQVNIGVITALAYGMFDAHSANIYIDKQGNFRFFDDTEILPHSNIALRSTGNCMECPFRLGLLELEECYVPLSEADRLEIQAELNKYQSKSSAFASYLESDFIKSKIQQLPPGWFNVKEIAAAMQERLNRMQKAIYNTSVSNLRDFIFATLPWVKFYSVLYLIPKLNQIKDKAPVKFPYQMNKIQRQFLPDVGSKSIEAIIMKCVKFGIDLRKVYSLCNSINYSFEDVLMQLLADLSKNNSDQVELAVRMEQALDVGEELIAEIMEKSEIDYKDKSRKSIAIFLEKELQKGLKKSKIQMIQGDKVEVFEFLTARPGTQAVVQVIKPFVREGEYLPNRYILHYKFNNLYLKCEIKYFNNPGKISLGNSPFIEPQHMHNFSNTFKWKLSIIYPKYFHPNIYPKNAAHILHENHLQGMNNWILGPDVDPYSLVLSFVDEKGRVRQIKLQIYQKNPLFLSDGKDLIHVSNLENQEILKHCTSLERQ